MKVAETMQYVPWLNKAENRIFRSTVQQALKFQNFVRQPARKPAVRPGSARCRPFSQVMYSCVISTNFPIR